MIGVNVKIVSHNSSYDKISRERASPDGRDAPLSGSGSRAVARKSKAGESDAVPGKRARELTAGQSSLKEWLTSSEES